MKRNEADLREEPECQGLTWGLSGRGEGNSLWAEGGHMEMGSHVAALAIAFLSILVREIWAHILVPIF